MCCYNWAICLYAVWRFEGIAVILLTNLVNTPLDMKFTDKLKSLREANKFTQRQIASMSGIGVSIYNRYERGERCMKRELVDKTAAIYHMFKNNYKGHQ